MQAGGLEGGGDGVGIASDRALPTEVEAGDLQNRQQQCNPDTLAQRKEQHQEDRAGDPQAANFEQGVNIGA
jgi:hypothetical protein